MAFILDGATLASGHRSGTLRIWDVATGKLKAEIKAHKDWISNVAFSPDGKYLATAGHRDSIKLWANQWGSGNSQK